MNFANLIILATSVVIAHGTWNHPYFHRRLPNYPVPMYHYPMYNPVYVYPMPVNNQQPMPMPVPVNNQQPQEQQLTEVEDQKNIE